MENTAESTEPIAQQPAEQSGQQPAEQPEKRTLHGQWIPFAIIGIAACIVAWISLVLNEYVSMACAGVSLVASCFGVCVGKGIWRNLAITCIIASAVLLVVFAIFFIGISLIEK